MLALFIVALACRRRALHAMSNNMLVQRPAVRTSERALRLRLRVAACETRAEHQTAAVNWRSHGCGFA